MIGQEMSENKSSKAWRTYEEVARHVLEHLSAQLGLARVEGKQLLPGKSGTAWEVDAKAVRGEDGAILLVECRRYKNRLSQEAIAAVALRIQEVGAGGGITVSPLPLQLGAALVAKAYGIQHIRLDPSSTLDQWIAKLEDLVAIGMTARVKVESSLGIKVIKGGKVVETRNV